jgi:hypothetical protein
MLSYKKLMVLTVEEVKLGSRFDRESDDSSGDALNDVLQQESATLLKTDDATEMKVCYENSKEEVFTSAILQV